GPSLRGSGVEWDIRKAKPYAAYSDFEFDIPAGEAGDTYDRYMVRLEEMRQSARIISQAVEKIPDGPLMAKMSKIIKPPIGAIDYILIPFIKIFIVFNVVAGVVALLTLAERKVAAWIQVRLGPMRVGPYGILQPLADGLKLMLKEDIVPAGADKWIFTLAPVI